MRPPLLPTLCAVLVWYMTGRVVVVLFPTAITYKMATPKTILCGDTAIVAIWAVEASAHVVVAVVVALHLLLPLGVAITPTQRASPRIRASVIVVATGMAAAHTGWIFLWCSRLCGGR